MMSPGPVWLVMRVLKYSLQEARTERWALKLRFSTITVISHRRSFRLCSSRQRSTCVLCTDDWNVNSEVLQLDIVMLNYISIIVKEEILHMKQNNTLNVTFSPLIISDRIYNIWTLTHTQSITTEDLGQSFPIQNIFHTTWTPFTGLFYEHLSVSIYLTRQMFIDLFEYLSSIY